MDVELAVEVGGGVVAVGREDAPVALRRRRRRRAVLAGGDPRRGGEHRQHLGDDLVLARVLGARPRVSHQARGRLGWARPRVDNEVDTVQLALDRDAGGELRRPEGRLAGVANLLDKHRRRGRVELVSSGVGVGVSVGISGVSRGGVGISGVSRGGGGGAALDNVPTPTLLVVETKRVADRLREAVCRVLFAEVLPGADVRGGDVADLAALLQGLDSNLGFVPLEVGWRLVEHGVGDRDKVTAVPREEPDPNRPEERRTTGAGVGERWEDELGAPPGELARDDPGLDRKLHVGDVDRRGCHPLKSGGAQVLGPPT